MADPIAITLPEVLDVLDTLSTVSLLGLVIWAFLTERIIPKGRLTDQKELTKEAIAGWRESTKAVDRMADAWEARNEAEERVRVSQR